VRLDAGATAIALLLTATGCLSANGYRVAKTLPKGTVDGHVGVSAFVFEDSQGTGIGAAPSGSVRAGLGSGFEAAVLFSGQPRFSTEVQYQIPLDLGPAHVAVAAGPFVGALPLESGFGDDDDVVLGLDALALVDVWLEDRVALVGFGGPTYAYAPGPRADAGLIQFGGGVRLVVARGFGIHIESATQWNPSFGEAIDTALGFAVVLGNVARE
jgi:hypothetical protein